MADVRVVVEQFSARHWSGQPYAYEDFMPGEQVIAMRHESGYSIFARASDPVSRYIIEIDQFRALTSSLGSEHYASWWIIGTLARGHAVFVNA